MAGAGLCLWYMVRNQPGPRAWLGLAEAAGDGRWFGIDPVAAGVFGVPAGGVVLVLVSCLTAEPAAAELAMVDALRRPGPVPDSL